MKREHHFFLAVAKFVFSHKEYGIVTVRDPITLKDAELYGLSPMLMYGVAVAGLPIYWMTFSALDDRRSITDVLHEAWSEATGLQGPPDILKVNRHVAQACPQLQSEMSRIGVEHVVAGAKDRSHPASLRSAQNASMWLNRARKAPPRTIEDLCQDAQEDHELYVRMNRFGGGASGEKRERLVAWFAQEPNTLRSGINREIPWNAGPWLTAWDANVAPGTPRYFLADKPEKKVWLLSGYGNHSASQADSLTSDVSKLVTTLLESWPNKAGALARHIDAKLKELKWFLASGTSLSRRQQHQLLEVLGIDYSERRLGYEPIGPYVLIARKEGPVDDIYDRLTCGGDANTFEVLPDTGSADPSWRYVVVSRCFDDASIFMYPRGDKISEDFTNSIFNFKETVKVPRDLYLDVVSTCARACMSPEANIKEAKAFNVRYEEKYAEAIRQLFE